MLRYEDLCSCNNCQGRKVIQAIAFLYMFPSNSVESYLFHKSDIILHTFSLPIKKGALRTVELKKPERLAVLVQPSASSRPLYQVTLTHPPVNPCNPVHTSPQAECKCAVERMLLG